MGRTCPRRDRTDVLGQTGTPLKGVSCPLVLSTDAPKQGSGAVGTALRPLARGTSSQLQRPAGPSGLLSPNVSVGTQLPRPVPINERTVLMAFESVPALVLLPVTKSGGTVGQGYVATRAAQHITTIAANDKSGRTAPIQKENGLLTPI